jgi:hypothetical protein
MHCIINVSACGEECANPLVKARELLYKPRHSAKFDAFGRYYPGWGSVAMRLDITYFGG